MRRYNLLVLNAAILGCIAAPLSFAATPINLQHQSGAFLQSFTSATSTMKQIRSDIDFNQTTHTRLQQMYLGYPVWGGDIVMHVPHNEKSHRASLTGTIYQYLTPDLQSVPDYVFSSAQAEKALQTAVQQYQKKRGIKNSVTGSNTSRIIFVDKNQKAHWAFLVSFESQLQAPSLPEKPTYIMDATTFSVYRTWNNIQTLADVAGGGFGGNEKMGKYSYDSLPKNYPALTMQYDAKNKLCSLQNADVTVKDARNKQSIVSFSCKAKSKEHNNVYWDAAFDAINGGYSPSNDALYTGKVVKEMYQKWYGIPVLTKNNKPMMLNMIVHKNMENAYWDGKQMTFGDGERTFYPLVSLGVGAHEISHGFTEQHSNLQYYGQSGGLNESFSDMAAQAAEFYSVGHSSWQIGAEIMKGKNVALRYMDDPLKDCAGRQRDNECSIDNVKDYNDDLDVHYSSGIFNKIFYLMGSSPNWDAKKAFDVMVQANAHYWTSTSTFANAACGVVKATGDYKYDTDTAVKAIKAVGLDPTKC